MSDKFEKIIADIKSLKLSQTILFTINTSYEDDYDDDEGSSEQQLFFFKKLNLKKRLITLSNSKNDEWTVDEDLVHEVVEYKIVEKSMKSKLTKTFQSKKPKTRAKHVGIEIELTSKLDDSALSKLLAENDLENNVQIKDDGSIRTSGEFNYSHELCVLADEKKVYEIVSRLCKVLKDNSKVNASCGLHVHLDMRNRNPKICYKNLFSMQKLLYSMNPESRMTNNFCVPKKSYFDINFNGQLNGNRYEGINFTAFSRHKTLEVRIHSGTLNPKKINNWVRILLKVINIKIEENHTPKIVDNYLDAKKALNLRGKLDQYVVERLKAFKENHKDKDMAIVLEVDTDQ